MPHPWHDISPDDNLPREFMAVIEESLALYQAKVHRKPCGSS